MKNKGFTLVEILAVIVILGILIVIAVPNVINMSKKTKNEMYESKVDMIEKAAQLYGEDNREELENGTISGIVSVKDLVSSNYLNKEDKSCTIGNGCVTDTRDNSSMDNKNVCLCTINKRLVATYIGDATNCSGTVCEGHIISNNAAT